jgi:hypothetical protein
MAVVGLGATLCLGANIGGETLEWVWWILAIPSLPGILVSVVTTNIHDPNFYVAAAVNFACYAAIFNGIAKMRERKT